MKPEVRILPLSFSSSAGLRAGYAFVFRELGFLSGLMIYMRRIAGEYASILYQGRGIALVAISTAACWLPPWLSLSWSL